LLKRKSNGPKRLLRRRLKKNPKKKSRKKKAFPARSHASEEERVS